MCRCDVFSTKINLLIFIYKGNIMSKEMRKQINKVKNFGQFLNEELVNKSSDDMKETILFHGTSLEHYNQIKNGKFKVNDFYVTDNEENAIEYAYQTTKNEDINILIVINSEHLDGLLKDDIHDIDYTGGDNLKQDGQYVFNGNIKKSIHSIINIDNKNIIDTFKTLV